MPHAFVLVDQTRSAKAHDVITKSHTGSSQFKSNETFCSFALPKNYSFFTFAFQIMRAQVSRVMSKFLRVKIQISLLSLFITLCQNYKGSWHWPKDESSSIGLSPMHCSKMESMTKEKPKRFFSALLWKHDLCLKVWFWIVYLHVFAGHPMWRHFRCWLPSRGRQVVGESSNIYYYRVLCQQKWGLKDFVLVLLGLHLAVVCWPTGTRDMKMQI